PARAARPPRQCPSSVGAGAPPDESADGCRHGAARPVAAVREVGRRTKHREHPVVDEPRDDAGRWWAGTPGAPGGPPGCSLLALRTYGNQVVAAAEWQPSQKIHDIS